MTTFKVADNLTLPESAPTDTFAFLGTRGSGKSYAAGRIVEAFQDADVQTVVVDPVGIWWGLRLAADGRAPGIDIPVFGGWHGDVPLEPTAGALCAQLVAERRLSVVLDVSEFASDAAQRRFVTDFARDLFDLKKRNRSPVHVVFEEAHEFLPQQVDAGAAAMVGAVKRLWKLGRNFGIGGSLVSQRAAELNKGALNLTQTLFTGKLKGPQDRKAIAGWAVDQDRDEAPLRSLPTLGNGRLIAWLETDAREVRFLPKRTFDASKTPEQGDRATAQALPPIDLQSVRSAMAATIEEAKANDPKALRAEIARLKAELAGAGAGGAADERAQLQAEIQALRGRSRLPIWLDGAVQDAIDLAAEAGHAVEKAAKRVVDIQKDLQGFERSTDGMEIAANKSPWPDNWGIDRAPAPVAPKDFPANPDGHKSFRIKASTKESSALSRCARAILNVLTQRGAATDSQLSALSGYRVSSSTFANGLSELRVAGFLDGPPERRQVTTAGRKANGPIEPLPRGPALLDYWARRLGKCERAMLETVFRAGSITRAKLSERTGYKETSSTFANGISSLRMLELIHGPNGGDLTIADVFTERAA